MAAVIEVKYFNSFVLNKTNTGASGSAEPIWNGSRGIPSSIGGYPTLSSSDDNNWAIEESRIRGGYNNISTDYGCKAYLVEEDPNASFRTNSMIYSGIFNSRTGINNSNVFSIAEDIIQSADPANGSIQKLYAENSNLIVFQEQKVSRALIDKDAIYSAEGGGAVTNSKLVIGTLQPYLGEYGISKNPESFAVYGYDKYFSDKNSNAILRLTNNGIVEISAYGMKDFFRDQLKDIGQDGLVLGGYDVHNSQYTVSLQKNPTTQPGTDSKTLAFDPKVNGWPTFFSYKPEQIFSIQNKFYSVKSGGLYQHYLEFNQQTGARISRNTFYNVTAPSSISFVVNSNPANSKNFLTIGYEGSSGWQVDTFTSDFTGTNEPLPSSSSTEWSKNFDITNPPNIFNSTSSVPAVRSYYEGEYVIVDSTAIAISASTTSVISIGSFSAVPAINSIVSGSGVLNNTKVVSYNGTNNEITVSQNVNIAANTLLSFNLTVRRSDYQTVFGTNQPNFEKYYSGFIIKENKYVSNLKNYSVANEKEIIFGQQVSGIKGFYSNVTMSTDKQTDPGGEKQLFNASTVYQFNNGY